MQKGSEDPRNLYVNNLPDMTDVELRNLFAPFGPIESVRTCHHKTTGSFAGYGFVLFEKEEDALKAIAAMNDYIIAGKKLSVKLKSSKPPTAQVPGKPPNSNVYIAGVPLSYTKKDLDDLFSPYGPIAESRILVDKSSGQSRGIGFVRYQSVESANASIEAWNNKVPPGGINALVCKVAADKVEAGFFGSPMGMSALASLGLPMNNLAAMAAMAGMGGMAGAANSYGPQRGATTAAASRFNPMAAMASQGRSRSPGMSADAASINPLALSLGDAADPNASALQSMFNMQGLGMGMGMTGFGAAKTGAQANPAASAAAAAAAGVPPPNSQYGYTLFVFHLPHTVTENDLHQLFSLYGVVTHVSIMRDPTTGISKGFGFVNMMNYADALTAIEFLNGFALGNKFLKVQFKKEK